MSDISQAARRQRVLKGRSPDRGLRERLKAKPELAKPVTKPPDPDALPKALKVVARQGGLASRHWMRWRYHSETRRTLRL